MLINGEFLNRLVVREDTRTVREGVWGRCVVRSRVVNRESLFSIRSECALDAVVREQFIATLFI